MNEENVFEQLMNELMSQGDAALDLYAKQLKTMHDSFIRAGFEETTAATFTGLMFADDLKRARDRQQGHG